MKWKIIIAMMAIAGCSLLGYKIRYPYWGGLWRPMIFAEGRIVELKLPLVRVEVPDGRNPWVYLNDDVSFSR